MKPRLKQNVSSSKDDQANSQRNKLLKKKNSGPIPIDLIIDIFLRLPTKSIARCRCVSKLWGSTLRLPHFTELFLTRSSSRPKLLFSCEFHKPGALLLFSAPQVHNSSLVTATYHMKLPLDGNYYDVGSFDHLRGLTCLSNVRILNGRKEKVTVIHNPTTRESLNLPTVEARSNLVKSFLGYDPIDKQFKVLSMNYNRRKFSVEHQILTLGTTNEWRKIECSIPHYAAGRWICIDGGLYYHAATRNSGGTKIVRFDVRNEKYSFINPFDERLCNPVLVNYKGKLGGLFSGGYNEVRRDSKGIELWVLVDAEKHQWLKHVYELPSLWKDIVATNDCYNFVGVISGTNEIVLVPRCYPIDNRPFYVIYYDFEKETIRGVEMQGMEACKYHIFNIFMDHIEDVKLLRLF